MKVNNEYEIPQQPKTSNQNPVSLVYAIAKLPAGSSEIDLNEGYVYDEAGFRQFCTDFDIKPLDYNDPLLLRHLADEFSNRCTEECEYDFSFQFVEAGLIEVYRVVDTIMQDSRDTVIDGLTKFAMERGCVCACCGSLVEDS